VQDPLAKSCKFEELRVVVGRYLSWSVIPGVGYQLKAINWIMHLWDTCFVYAHCSVSEIAVVKLFR
jgi:hypothetical protein